MTKRWSWIILDIILCAALVAVFGIWYLSNHAYGAWGNDSPGYIYTAGQLLRGEPLVSQDELAQSALAFFGDERFARFVVPAHHEIISPQGWIASRYPIGLSLIMALVVALSRQPDAIYSVVPVAAVIVVLLTYLLAVITLPLVPPLKRVAGLLAAFSVGLADLFASSAVSEPMREIPSMVFFLVSCIALYVAVTYVKRPWCAAVLLVLGGLTFGYSVNIRETSAVLLLPLVLLIWSKRGNNQTKHRSTMQRWWPMAVFLLSVIVSLSLTIWNSTQLTLHKEKFRTKDISRIAITSNFDHVQSLSLSNLLDNQGKFKPGVGGLQQYWQVMQGFSIWPLFIVLAGFGLYALWHKQRRLTVVYVTWFGLIYLLFAMWINPYPRYILPLLPVLAILSTYGTIVVGDYVGRWLHWSRWLTRGMMALLIVSFFIAQRPAVAQRHEQLRSDVGVYKAITATDAEALRQVIIQAQAAAPQDKPPLLMMFGDYKGGLAEIIMTMSDLRVIRFPGKPNEQPKFSDLQKFLKQLQERYTLLVWYDDTINANEQRLLHEVILSEPLATASFSFQPNITIYAITQNN